MDLEVPSPPQRVAPMRMEKEVAKLMMIGSCGAEVVASLVLPDF